MPRRLWLRCVRGDAGRAPPPPQPPPTPALKFEAQTLPAPSPCRRPRAAAIRRALRLLLLSRPAAPRVRSGAGVRSIQPGCGSAVLLLASVSNPQSRLARFPQAPCAVQSGQFALLVRFPVDFAGCVVPYLSNPRVIRVGSSNSPRGAAGARPVRPVVRSGLCCGN